MSERQLDQTDNPEQQTGTPQQDSSVHSVAAQSDRPHHIDDQERDIYNALDPAAATSQKPWELEITSPWLRKVAYITIVIVMAVHIFMAAVVGVGYTGAAVTPVDHFAFIGIGLVISVIAWIGLTRPRVRVNEDGVEVRNFIGTRFYGWHVIYGLAFPRGSRMARLELPEFEYVPLWAMQISDRNSVIEDVDTFRALEAKYMPTD